MLKLALLFVEDTLKNGLKVIKVGNGFIAKQNIATGNPMEIGIADIFLVCTTYTI